MPAKRDKKTPLSQELIDSSDSDSEEQPALKKAKNESEKGKKSQPDATKKRKVKEVDSESDDGDDNADDKLRKDSKGDQYVLLSDKRRVTVRAFKKSILIDIRETYDKDGEEGLPGKKGIALSSEQWNALKASMGAIDKAIGKL